MPDTEIENGFTLVTEQKSIHVGPSDGLPPATEYPIGTVIASPDGERFRLDRVPSRTQWVAVEARQPEAKDYSKFSVRELIVAATAGDDDAATALEERLTQVHTVQAVGGGAPPGESSVPAVAAEPVQLATAVRFEPDPDHPGLFRPVHIVVDSR